MANLTLVQAKARLGRMLQYLAAPALSSEELDDLAAMLPQMIDADGVLPDEDGYVPTYSPYAFAFREAAAEGWEWKAAKVAGQFDAATGSGTKFERSQQFDMCMEMAAVYGGGSGRALSGAFGSVRIATASTYDDTSDDYDAEAV